jgi:hypothetical protein
LGKTSKAIWKVELSLPEISKAIWKVELSMPEISASFLSYRICDQKKSPLLMVFVTKRESVYSKISLLLGLPPLVNQARFSAHSVQRDMFQEIDPTPHLLLHT